MTLPVGSFVGGLEQSFQEAGCLCESGRVVLRRVLGEQHPGEGDVLELAQVGEAVGGRQPTITRPG